MVFDADPVAPRFWGRKTDDFRAGGARPAADVREQTSATPRGIVSKIHGLLIGVGHEEIEVGGLSEFEVNFEGAARARGGAERPRR